MDSGLRRNDGRPAEAVTSAGESSRLVAAARLAVALDVAAQEGAADAADDRAGDAVSHRAADQGAGRAADDRAGGAPMMVAGARVIVAMAGRIGRGRDRDGEGHRGRGESEYELTHDIFLLIPAPPTRGRGVPFRTRSQSCRPNVPLVR